ILSFKTDVPVGLRRGCCCGARFARPLVIAFFIRTRDHHPILALYLHQEITSTTRSFRGDRLGRRRELAFWVIRTTVESVPLAGALFHEFPVLTLRTFHTDEVLFDVLA